MSATSLEQLKQPWMEGYDIVYGEDKEVKEVSDFDSLLEQTTRKDFKEGEVYPGRVVSIGNDYVMVEIGYKQEGLVSIKEFISFDGDMEVKVGDQIEVYLEKLESSYGNLILSKDKAEILKAWDKISEACEQGTSLNGRVVAKVKGGLSVDIGVKAFLPGSQIDLRPTRHLDKYIGKKMKFKVIKFNKKRGNIVLSRRAILQEERGKMRDEILGHITQGMIVKGVVKNLTDYGAFIDLGGIDGLLHITDMSWGRVKHPSNLLNIGDELEVKILKFDPDKERISLGLKQVRPNPWDNVYDKYKVGGVVTGEIVSVKDYGIFMELDEGIEGLVHVSEMSWTGKIKNPAKHYVVGTKIEVQVLDIGVENKRISLGIKQLQPNPWEKIVKQYPVGTKVKGTITSVVEFGIFVDIGEGVDALIHISDISWVKKNINLQKEGFVEGKEIEAVVLTIEPENSKFFLGIKQLEENPWKKIEQRFSTGTVVQVSVVRIADFGIFVELEPGVEGLIHISELSSTRINHPEEVAKVGDKVEAMIISIDQSSQKIALSIKEKQRVGEFGQKESQTEKVKTATLADKFKGLIGVGSTKENDEEAKS